MYKQARRPSTKANPEAPFWASLVAQTGKNLPATMQEARVPSLSQEDPLEKGMATQSSVLAWGILWTEKSDGSIKSRASQRVGHRRVTFTVTFPSELLHTLRQLLWTTTFNNTVSSGTFA